MKNLLLLTGLLLTIAIPALLIGQQDDSSIAEQNATELNDAETDEVELNAVEPESMTVETRLSVMEKRLNSLERRIKRLEKSDRLAAKSQTKLDKDELRNKRQQQLVEDLMDEIEIIEAKVHSLPNVYRNSEDRLDALDEEWQLLSKEERNYQKIIDLVKKNPDLGIDILTIQKDLIDCQGRKKEVDLKRDNLRERISERRRSRSLTPRKGKGQYVPTK